MRRSSTQRRFAGLVLVVGAIGALAAGLLLRAHGAGFQSGARALPVAQRRVAPGLAGEPLVPPAVRLPELRGEPVLINFWASWCFPCRKEAPALARFERRMAERAHVVGVNYQDSEHAALAFVNRFRWRFPVVRDTRGMLGSRYRLLGVPTTFVLDRRGRIALRLTGAQTYAGLVRAVTAVE